MKILAFRWQDRADWNTTDVTPPPGEYLASDGVDTWVIRREGGPFKKYTRVRWWRGV